MNIKYQLERYRSGGANRYTCPNCGKSKSFTRYINIETGEYVSDECGKCNHESSCGYHYPPHDYFHDHPEINIRTDWHPDYVNGVRTILSHKSNTQIKPAEFSQTEFYDTAWAEESIKRDSTFSHWLRSLPINPEQLDKVIEDYYVGSTSYDIHVENVNYGRAAIFWMIDEKNRIHDAKLIAYTCDGHRVQNWGNSIRALCVKKGVGPQLEQTEKVLYGLHLLNRYPDKDICIVESEKTATIAACIYPQYLWMATGGCGNLQKNKIQPLLNRHLLILPDSGEYDKWKERMQQSGHKNYHVLDFMEGYPPNTDIADVIIG